MSRTVIWVVSNGIIIACAVSGLFFDIEPARNVFLFLVWVMVFTGTIAMFNKELRLELRAKGQSVPSWVSVTNDIAIMMMLASKGMFFVATAVLWQMGCEQYIYKGED